MEEAVLRGKGNRQVRGEKQETLSQVTRNGKARGLHTFNVKGSKQGP